MTDKKAVKPQRKIIHIDFDAFFAAIEMRDNPSLLSRPVAVGGSPWRRGVIATCNYEARSFGVRSAMASAHAVRLCPDLHIIPPRFEVYKEASRQAHAIFNGYTDSVEPLSLDEAYLDVSATKQCAGSATLIARSIKKQIQAVVGITASAGVAPNKFLAKIASEWQKPDGLFVINPDQVNDFVFELPVTRLHGVGKVTAKKLRQKGIKTCGALRQYSRLELTHWFGSFGQRLWEMARGEDSRPVESNRRRKSLSVEHTYTEDIASIGELLKKTTQLLDDLRVRFDEIKTEYAITKRFVKVKFNNFTQTTLEESLDQKEPQLDAHFKAMVSKAWDRGQRPVRLLGIGVRLVDLCAPGALKQLELFKN